MIDEYYETEIISGEADQEAVIKLPYGNHVLKVRMFPYDDAGFFNEAEYARHDNIGFTIGNIIQEGTNSCAIKEKYMEKNR